MAIYDNIFKYSNKNKDSAIKSYKFILILIIILLSSLNLRALDTRGKDFWFNYMPNFHNYDTSSNSDSLIIFIAAEKVTNCTIAYSDSNGKITTYNFTTFNPNQVYEYRIPWKTFELLGFDDISMNQCERIAKQSFHVTSDNDISLIAHSKARLTNDAFLVFPTHALGNEYYILCYNSDGGQGSSGYSGYNSTPSQFSITAVQDSTNIEITPKSSTEIYGMSQRKVILNKGESYLVQSELNSNNFQGDLTGSYIKSDKPIAVFGGQQRAAIPINSGSFRPSRDILIEQMAPINYWGKNAYIVPFKEIQSVTPNGTDLFRVLSAFDNTEVYLNEKLVATLKAGEFYEGVLDQIYQLESTGPILVAEYKKTSDDGSSGSNVNYGDPFMIIVPPKEQFSRIYRCISSQVYDTGISGFSIPEPSFKEQYITLVAPDIALASVKIDKVSIPVTEFTKIYKSGYSATTQKVKDGTHDVTCDEEVGIFIYGYGPANSYGYIGGMSSKNIDFNPPIAEVKQNCDEFEIFTLDTNIYDSGIDSILTPQDLNKNIVYNIPSHQDTSLFSFSANVIDKYQDAKMTVIIKDSIGYSRKITKEIMGFTIGIKNIKDKLEIKDTILAVTDKCYQIELFNYGNFTQTFDLKFALGNTKMTLSDSGKISLNSGQSKIIQVCYNPLLISQAIDSLIVTDTCNIRTLATFNLSSIGDSLAPKVTITGLPCSKSKIINISDSAKFDTGIKSWKVVDSLNCIINSIVFSAKLCVLNVLVIDPKQDAFYTINTKDEWGNSFNFSDTLRGSTLGYEIVKNDSMNILNFYDKVIGGVYCDSIKFKNTGTFDINLTSPRLINNINYSIPQSQLPFVIKANSTKYMMICFHPLKYLKNKTYTDSLIFDFNCETKYIKLQGQPLEFVIEASNKCGQVSKITSSYVPSMFGFNSISPNPSGGIMNINFETNKSESLNFTIYDILGNKKFDSDLKVSESGIYEVEIIANDLVSGVYYCLLNNGKKSLFKSLIINK